MSHTPGPWNASVDEGPPFTVTRESPLRDLRIVAEIFREDSDQGIANARLIAAAPLLLEGLKSALEDLADANPKCVRLAHYRSIAAKAEGK